MPRVSFLAHALCLLLVLAAAHPAAAFDACRAADINDSGQVDLFDWNEITAAINSGTPSPEMDLDGSGPPDIPDFIDRLMLFGLIFRTCTDCTADLDDDGDVDAGDQALLETAYGRECRLDMDRNDVVDDDIDYDIWTLYFQGPPNPATARADFDGNGTVNINDLFLLLPSIGNDCSPDLNKDGAVDVQDLEALQAALGDCPGNGRGEPKTTTDPGEDPPLPPI